MDFSFVIPCYCSENNLESVVDEIRTAMASRPEFTYEIILVNDHSKDHTKELINRLSGEDSRIRGIHFAKNFGQPAALMAGFRAARGEYIMTSDDDGQTPVETVWDFYAKLSEGYDLVCVKFSERPGRTLFRRLGTLGNTLMLERFLGKPKDTSLSSFFMAKRSVIEEIIRYEGPYPYMAGLLLRSSGRIANLEIEQRLRKSGSSGYTFAKLLTLWANGVTAFSVKPLRLPAVCGFICGLLGALLLLALLVLKLIHPEYALALHAQTGILLLLGGLILASISLIGEYTGRIYMSLNHQPQYLIESRTDDPEKDAPYAD